MTNILNTRLSANNNIIPAGKISEGKKYSRFIEAPDSLYKYSLYDELDKKNDIRKSVLQQEYKKTDKKFPGKLLLVLAAAAGVFLLKGRKHIK